MNRIWWVSILVVVACSGTGPSAAKAGGKTGPHGVSGEKASANAVDPAIYAAGQALVDAMTPALASCHTLIDPLDPAAAEASKLAFEQPALDTACGALRDLYDAQIETTGGKARQIDLLMTHAARLGDGVDYLGRALGDIGSERKIAVTQLQEALGKASEAVKKWPEVKVYPYRANYTGEPGVKQWTLDLENDGRDGTNLRNNLERFAIKQGLKPAQVRRRMLDVYGRIGLAYDPVRVAALAASDLTPELKASRGAYLTALRGWIDAYVSVTNAYIKGEVKDAATQAKLTAQADAALATFKTAWDAQKAAQ